MATLTTAQYDALERAITDGRRLAVRRGNGRGEVVVVPRALRLVNGRERIDATHPTTGDRLELYVDEIETFEVVR
jgi:hypothetical protein